VKEKNTRKTRAGGAARGDPISIFKRNDDSREHSKVPTREKGRDRIQHFCRGEMPLQEKRTSYVRKKKYSRPPAEKTEKKHIKQDLLSLRFPGTAQSRGLGKTARRASKEKKAYIPCLLKGGMKPRQQNARAQNKSTILGPGQTLRSQENGRDKSKKKTKNRCMRQLALP